MKLYKYLYKNHIKLITKRQLVIGTLLCVCVLVAGASLAAVTIHFKDEVRTTDSSSAPKKTVVATKSPSKPTKVAAPISPTTPTYDGPKATTTISPPTIITLPVTTPTLPITTPYGTKQCSSTLALCITLVSTAEEPISLDPSLASANPNDVLFLVLYSVTNTGTSATNAQLQGGELLASGGVSFSPLSSLEISGPSCDISGANENQNVPPNQTVPSCSAFMIPLTTNPSSFVYDNLTWAL